MTLRVSVLTEDPAGPSARHRWIYPTECFKEHDVAISIHDISRPVRMSAFAACADADLVVVHRKLFRLPDLRRLRATAGGPLVYDLDDAVMVRPSGRRRQRSFFRALRFSRTVRSSILFMAGNRYLVSRGPRRVPAVIRHTPVDVDRYRVKSDWPGAGRVVGWIGTGATLPYLLGSAPALTALAAKVDGLVLRVIGPKPPEVPGVRVEHVPWSEESEGDALLGLDVGILPLPDDPWTRGKCAFKALQYMAAGLPVVASPVGMNGEVVVEGETGHLAGDADAWVAALSALLGDADLRRRMGAAGRRRAEEKYSTRVLTPPVARSLLRIRR